MSNLKMPKMTIGNLRNITNGHDKTIAYKTDIVWNVDKTKCGIYHHNSLIAVIDESGYKGHERIVSVSTAGYASMTTIARIRKILHDNTHGYYGARIKDYTPYITCDQSHYTGGFMYDISGNRFFTVIVNNGNSSNLITDETFYNGIH